jgi:PPOX class probable F420-dependent enzyme
VVALGQGSIRTMTSTALDRGVTPLEGAASLSLATVRPDGRPHVVPLWFLWDGEAIVVVSKPHAQKVRNLVAKPRAMVSVGQPGDADASLLEVNAEVEAGGAAALADRLWSKYRHQCEALGLTVGEFVETHSFVIRLRPTRWLTWGGPGRAIPPITGQANGLM